MLDGHTLPLYNSKKHTFLRKMRQQISDKAADELYEGKLWN